MKLHLFLLVFAIVFFLLASCAVWLSQPQYQDSYPVENIHHYIVLPEQAITP